MNANRPVPKPTPETEPFWSATLEGRLRLQQCRDCGEYIFYPRLVCPHCLSDALEWRDCSGRGVVYSYTVVERAPAAFAEDAPYVVALVELAEGPRMMSWIRLEDVDAVSIGMPVTVDFERVSDEAALPVFRPLAD